MPTHLPHIPKITRVDELEWCTHHGWDREILLVSPAEDSCRRNAPSLASETSLKNPKSQKAEGPCRHADEWVQMHYHLPITIIILYHIISYYIIQSYESYLLPLSLLIANSVDCWVWIPGGAVTCQSQRPPGNWNTTWNPMLEPTVVLQFWVTYNLIL